jgi:hypothetical protein
VIAPGCKAVDLRAERQGGGNGRVYTLNVAVTDRSGNTAQTTFRVYVPKSQGNTQVVDSGPAYAVHCQ